VRYLASRFSIFRACFSIFAEDSAWIVGAKAIDAKAMATSSNEFERRKRRKLFMKPQKEENIDLDAMRLRDRLQTVSQ